VNPPGAIRLSRASAIVRAPSSHWPTRPLARELCVEAAPPYHYVNGENQTLDGLVETEVSEKIPREAANDLDPSVFDQD
jgi:hypothetical protein